MTGQILKTSVEAVKGQILAGWAQKFPEPWPTVLQEGVTVKEGITKIYTREKAQTKIEAA